MKQAIASLALALGIALTSGARAAVPAAEPPPLSGLIPKTWTLFALGLAGIAFATLGERRRHAVAVAIA